MLCPVTDSLPGRHNQATAFATSSGRTSLPCGLVLVMAATASPWLRPAILCGQHSLEIFCLGVFLAFAAHFAKVEISPGIPMQILVSVLGILIMIGVAWLLTWYKGATARKVAAHAGTATARPSLGGEA